jgi:opacity protein-like surface antigen
MKSFVALATAALAASSASAAAIFPRDTEPANCNITTFQLTANLTVSEFSPPYADIQYFQLLYANNSVYFGQARYEYTSEPLIIEAESGFLSEHQAPTGFQFAYVYPGQTKPLTYSVAHGGVVPEGASQMGFNFTGNLWGVNGTTDKWVACPTTFSSDGNWTTAQVYYQDGAANSSCTPISLLKYVYGNPGSNSNF